MVMANRLSEISPDQWRVLQIIDEILESGNEMWTGEDIRQHLAEAGFVIVKAEAD